LPVTQMGLQMFRAQAANPQSEVSQALMVLKNPEVKKIVDLAADMFSHEVFMYGDESCINFLDLMMELNAAQRFQPLMLKLQGAENGMDRRNVQAEALLSTVVENLDNLAVPNVLVGFKLDKPAAANEALIKLEMFLNIAMAAAPPQLQGTVKRETVAGHEYLVLRLNGKMIPWNGSEVEKLQETGLDEEDAAKLIDHIKEMNLVIALGVRENYLLSAIGSSTECIEKLGTGDRLIDLPQFKPLAKFSDKKLTSISYGSAELNQAISFQGKDLDQLYSALDEFLDQADLGKEKTEQILGDAQMLVEDLKGMLPEAGAEMAFSFLCEQGVETYDYNWGDHPQIDGSKPLSLLEHVGGNPLFGFVSRGKVDVNSYDMMVKWLTTGWKYVNEFGVPAMGAAEREKFEAYATDVLPLVKRLDKATRECLIPALADGQSALVFDGKFTSKQLHAQLPEWEKAMPLPELGLVIGVSDAKLLKQGVSEYFAVAGDLLNVVRKNEPNSIPEGFELPLPQVSEAPTDGTSATIYSYPLPPQAGMDKNLVPNAGLSDNVAVLSLSTAHTQRLLKKTPFTAGGVLAKADRPLAVAAWFNWAALLDTAMPWIDYALDQIDEAHLGGDRATAVGQIHVLLDVLKCSRSVTVESYLEDDCFVTHSLLEIHDVPK